MYALRDLTGHCYVHFAVVFTLRESECINTLLTTAASGCTNRFGFGDISLFTFPVNKPGSDIGSERTTSTTNAKQIDADKALGTLLGSFRRILFKIDSYASLMRGNRLQCLNITVIQIRAVC